MGSLQEELTPLCYHYSRRTYRGESLYSWEPSAGILEEVTRGCGTCLLDTRATGHSGQRTPYDQRPAGQMHRGSSGDSQQLGILEIKMIREIEMCHDLHSFGCFLLLSLVLLCWRSCFFLFGKECLSSLRPLISSKCFSPLTFGEPPWLRLPYFILSSALLQISILAQQWGNFTSSKSCFFPTSAFTPNSSVGIPQCWMWG